MLRDLEALPGDLQLAPHRALVDHWLDLYRAAGGALPALRAIDPLRLGRHLPDICILDHEGDDNHRFRLAGGNVNEFYGGEAKGRLLHELVEARTAERLLPMARSILAEPAAVLHGLSSMLPDWNNSVALQRISLPLADAEGHARHIISATVFRHDRAGVSGVVSADYRHDYRIPLGPDAIAWLARRDSAAAGQGA